MNGLTQKMETFCLKYFELGNATEAAIIAGYSSKNARAIASINLTKVDIQTRLQGLRQKAEDASVMDVLERKQRLTEISRARLTDFMVMGKDGTWCDIGPEVPYAGAIQEMKSSTEYDKEGNGQTLHTSVKLHNPIQAMDLLNKMDKLYTDGATVNIDNRKIEVTVHSEKSKDLLTEIAEGIAPHNDDNNQGI